MLPLFRELYDFLRFFRRTSPQVQTICFYAEHSGHYPAFEGLFQEITKVHRQRICYITSEFSDPIREQADQKMDVYYIRMLLPVFMVFLRCRVLVMTMPDLDTFHIKRSIHNVHYVYVFHALVSVHMMYRAGAFDGYDSILCAGPHHAVELLRIAEQQGRPPQQLVRAGYWRLERIYQRYQAYRAEEQRPVGHIPTVLIAPSWGENNVIEQFGKRLATDLLKAGWRVILRPHPETWQRSGSLLAEIAAVHAGNELFTLERSVAGDTSLLQADVLICDLSGIALEYALGTERPVLFIDIPAKIKNPAWRDVGIEPIELKLRGRLGVVISASCIGTVPAEAEKLMTNQKAYAAQLSHLRGEVVYNFGSSSHAGARHIMHVCGRRS